MYSGCSTALNVCPLCPGCPPLFFPLGLRRLLGRGFLSPSLEGGLLLVNHLLLLSKDREQSPDQLGGGRNDASCALLVSGVYLFIGWQW